ncbi:putative bifunctional diguanylate cyclase/phosphodiesterase [Euzebya tangerina]|uniref:putative bifunctional diguanylate cyclase/phosphodiesterase n=1 Tax=Euzebya tangerina TaxID=591198 RepID=UPI000E320501|nr:EAL domain-containing protein [Euzebya tangerina]
MSVPSEHDRADVARHRLGRHPQSTEVSRIASALTGALSQVVVFQAGRGFVVGASDPEGVLRPRHLVEAELDVRQGKALVVRTGGILAVAILDAERIPAAVLTVHSEAGAIDDDVWLGLGRQLSAVLVDRTVPDAKHQALLNGLRDIILLLDGDMQIKWVSDSVTSLLGRTPREVVGKSAVEYVHPDDLGVALDAISRVLKGLDLQRVTIRLLDYTDQWIPVEITGTDQSGDPALQGMVMSLRYADYESEAGARADRLERRSLAILSGLRDGLVATDQFGAVTLVNDMARAMFDIDADVPPGDLTLTDFPVLAADGRLEDLRAIGSRKPGRIRRRSGQVRHVVTSVQPIRGPGETIDGRVVAFHDVTSERRARAELRHQAMHDQLTGLANRRRLLTRLDELEQTEPRVSVAACFIDVDGFKLINDTHGHRVGDELITVAARRLAAELRSADLLVRQGGDEFVALLVDVEESQAAVIAERARQALAEPYRLGAERFDLTASIGVATARGQDWDGELLLQQADMALYAAKERGRNRVAPYNSSLADAVTAEQGQRRTLKNALDGHDLEMHFQPVVDMATNRTVGFEALARIRRTGALVQPHEFMAAIVNTGLMWDLDRRGFALSCAALREMTEAAGVAPGMACNFSSVSLGHPEFLETVQSITTEHSIDPRQVCVEITESAAFDVGGASVAVLDALRDRGFHIALDDFGTGYSSLGHLRDLPISTVKVDRSFIERLDTDPGERAIVEAVVSLAKTLRLGVVAEGVDTASQLAEVAALGFDRVQGWLFAPALDLPSAIDHWVEEGRAQGTTAGLAAAGTCG